MTPNPLMLARPVAVVTGGCTGIGLRTARTLGQHGPVLICDRAEGPVANALEVLREEGIGAEGQVCDITDPQALAKLAEKASEIGPLGAIVNCAAISGAMGNWFDILRVDLIGAALVEQAFRPIAVAGTVGLFIGSFAGARLRPDATVEDFLRNPLQDDFAAKLAELVGIDTEAETSPLDSYRLAKRGVIEMCKAKAVDWASVGARIVSVSPGYTDTPMTRAEREADPNSSSEQLLRATPLKRAARPQEIANAIEFLCSTKASFITGVDLLVDGGLSSAVTGASTPAVAVK